MIMKPQLAVCVDSSALESLVIGKEYILRYVEMGSEYYYVSHRHITHEGAFFGILRGNYFKIIGPLDHMTPKNKETDEEHYMQMSLF